MTQNVKPQVASEDLVAKTEARLTELLAEMQALVKILPPGATVFPPEVDPKRQGRAEDIAISEEDAVAEGFDNMPL